MWRWCWQQVRQAPSHLRIRLLVLLFGGALFWLLLWMSQTPSQLIFQNQSGQVIRQLHLRLAGASSTLTDVPIGQQCPVPVGREKERQYQLDAQLADGTRLHSQGQLPAGSQRLILLPGGQLRFTW